MAILVWVAGCNSSPTIANRPLPPRGEAQVASSASSASAVSNAPKTLPLIEASTSASYDNEAMATIADLTITRRQLDQPLIEAYGLQMLAKIAQLELAKKNAKEVSITASPDDIAKETDRYVASLFNEEKDPVLRSINDDLERAKKEGNLQRITALEEDLRKKRAELLDQLLKQQKITRTDFTIVMETNTYLRKIAEVMVKDSINDANLHSAFNQLYGEHVVVKDIALANVAEAMEAKRRIGEGQSFEQVVQDMSRNRETASIGGEMKPFTRDTPDNVVPDSFRQVAFDLKPGEVSDPVGAGNGYHIIKLVQRVPPRFAKFEDVKDGVREYLHAQLLDNAVRVLHQQLQRAIAENLKVIEPELKRQFDTQVVSPPQTDDIKEKTDIKKELERRRETIHNQNIGPATEPTTTPTTTPITTRPATMPSN